MEDTGLNYSIVVFPFLKTGEKVTIGKVIFRPTEDLTGLTEQQSASVNEIAGMLYLQGSFRVRSATYAIVPYIDLTYTPTDIRPYSDLK